MNRSQILSPKGFRYWLNTVVSVGLLVGVASMCLVGACSYPMVRLSHERIDVWVYPDAIRVRGVYGLENPLPVPLRMPIAFPVAADVGLSDPLWLRVRKLSPPEPEPISVDFAHDTPRFVLSLEPRETGLVEIEYLQKAENGSGRYALKSRRRWGESKPYYGMYRLHPTGTWIADSNYPVRSLASGVLFFERRDFIPGQDWTFSWQPLAEASDEDQSDRRRVADRRTPLKR